MEQEILRKVQLTLLDIAIEIKRVCEEHDIRYFLSDGSFLGAVRHQGFIPWDDDMDIGMLREDYEKFCQIAPTALKPEYCLETWHADDAYGLPFGKVVKRGTVYLEWKRSGREKEQGFYVDVFPFDNAPADEEEQRKLTRRLVVVARMMSMKCGYHPWQEESRVIWKKRIGYLYFTARALPHSHTRLAQEYEALAVSKQESGIVMKQTGRSRPLLFPKEWCRELAQYSFEGISFPGPKNYDAYLTRQYGRYLQLPPEGSRENRHQIKQIDFGNDGGTQK